MEIVYKACTDAMIALGHPDANVFVQVQPVDSGQPALPAIVYSSVGRESITTQEGPFDSAEIVQVDSRASSYQTAREIDTRVVKELRESGRYTATQSTSSIFDEQFNIRRVVRAVTIQGIHGD